MSQWMRLCWCPCVQIWQHLPWDHNQGWYLPHQVESQPIIYRKLFKWHKTIYSWTSIIDFPGPVLSMNINKIWSWKVETIKSSLILPNVSLKRCFNLFRFEKVPAAWDQQLSWCIQLKSDWVRLLGNVILDSALVK